MLPNHKGVTKKMERQTDRIRDIIPYTQEGEVSMGSKVERMEMAGGKCETMSSIRTEKGTWGKSPFCRET